MDILTEVVLFLQEKKLTVIKHWLPVKYKKHFSILLLNVKTLNGMAPAYISDFIKVREHTRCSLCSSSVKKHNIN